MKLFDKTLTVVERALDVRLARQNVLSSNIANVDTPGYQPRDIDFRAAMESATREEPFADGTPSTSLKASSFTVAESGSTPGLDGNGVDLDRAMVAMAENAIQYGAAARGASKKLAILRYVASDGNGG